MCGTSDKRNSDTQFADIRSFVSLTLKVPSSVASKVYVSSAQPQLQTMRCLCTGAHMAHRELQLRLQNGARVRMTTEYMITSYLIKSNNLDSVAGSSSCWIRATQAPWLNLSSKPISLQSSSQRCPPKRGARLRGMVQSDLIQL